MMQLKVDVSVSYQFQNVAVYALDCIVIRGLSEVMALESCIFSAVEMSVECGRFVAVKI